MPFRKFILSFASTALLVAPFAINANTPVVIDEIVVAPLHGENAVVEGLSFSSVVVKQDKSTATIHVTAKNNTKNEIRTNVAAALMQRPVTSPMARMVPMPTEVAHTGLALGLAPGESFSKTVVVQLPKYVTKQIEDWERVEKKSANKGGSNSESEFAFLMGQPSAPSFFTSVRSAAPKVQARQLARK
jgi:hypothetical protein